MTALGWVAVMPRAGSNGCYLMPFRLAVGYSDRKSFARKALKDVGYLYVWPECQVSLSKRPTGDLYKVIGLTRETRDGSMKLVLRASAPAR